MGKARKIKLKKAENQGIILPTKVSYAVTAGHLALAEGKRSSKRKIRITGGIAVARAILRLIYLWDEVRVKGGAYGSGLTMDRFGNFAFTSYRDPTPKKSLQVYRKAPEFLRQFVRDKKDLTEHIIGTAGKMYIPASPRQTGDSASADVLSGITQEYKQKLYGEILRVDYADVLTAAEILEKALTHSVCAIAGAKAELEASTDVLDTVKEF